MLVDDYPYDKLLDDHKYVICGFCALARTGLIVFPSHVLCCWTQYENLDGLDAIGIQYQYNPAINYEYDVIPMHTNSLILLPSKERAIVEYILWERWCDEGLLIEALKTYGFQKDGDFSKLYPAAEHFSLPKKSLDYWIQEALTDDSILAQ